jgi:hypothetical protein
MKRNPASEEKPDSDRYIENAKDRFFFDSIGGIYKPKSYKTESKSGKEANKSQRFRITTTISVLTLLAVGIYAYYAALQWCEMKKAADAAQQAAGEARLSRLQAEASLNATIQQFQLDQRAWLGVSQPIVVSLKDAQSGKPDFRAQVINTGKTPANNVSIAPVTSIIKKGEFCKTTYKPEAVLFAGVHLPTAVNTIAFPFGEKKIGPGELAAIEAGQLSWCIYAKISYNDVFKGTPVHVTEFCGVLQRDKSHFTACKHNNYAD